MPLVSFLDMVDYGCLCIGMILSFFDVNVHVNAVLKKITVYLVFL